MHTSTDILICGAGIAGISSAYHLAVRHGVRNILLVDERPPLSLTSDKSTECYRNWWPGPGDAMVALMNRSIDLLDELVRVSGNVFHLNQRGYLYVTGDSAKLSGFISAAEEPSRLGAGQLRVHRANRIDRITFPEVGSGEISGADLYIGAELVHQHFPYLTEHAVAALYVRRAGWFSAQQLGMYLLAQARAAGVQLLQARVTGVEVVDGRVRAVRLDNGQTITTGVFINAAGPFLNDISHLIGVELPVYNELHLKTAFNDYLGVVPRDAPLLIWNDPQILAWSDEERELLAEESSTRGLLDELASGVHTRPEGGAGSQTLLMLWEYHLTQSEPILPPPLDPQYPEITLRGLVALLPGMQHYIGRSQRPSLDGGYYTKTRENRPLIGPLPVTGAYVIGALSGYGMMASCAAGELLAAHVTDSPLPSYAAAFALERYQDPRYLSKLVNWGDSGQL